MSALNHLQGKYRVRQLKRTELARRYWSDLKRKLAAEGSELYEKIVQLKLPSADGKKYLTDVATTEQLFLLIQSIPSKRALHFTNPPDELPLASKEE